MRVAALYDIHSNLPALEAVLADIAEIGVDHIIVGGDVVPGPIPRETIAALRSLPVPTDFLQGNGERDTVAMFTGNDIHTVPEQAREIIGWVGRVLSPADLELFMNWPPTVRLEVPGLGDVLFCHATPRSDREILTVLTPEERLLPIFETVAASVVVCGHTHMQFDRMVGRTRVVNAGSVGMPFGHAGAYWLLLGPGVELRCTAYDGAAAAQRIRASDYPHADDFAAHHVERPPSEATMLEIFERAAVT
jgi:predicted phosphodiesterase